METIAAAQFLMENTDYTSKLSGFEQREQKPTLFPNDYRRCFWVNTNYSDTGKHFDIRFI
jgi:hypothetical protein